MVGRGAGRRVTARTLPPSAKATPVPPSPAEFMPVTFANPWFLALGLLVPPLVWWRLRQRRAAGGDPGGRLLGRLPAGRGGGPRPRRGALAGPAPRLLPL